VVDDWEHLLSRLGRGPDWLFSARATRPYTDVAYRRGDVLVFGRESSGLPPRLVAAHADKLLTIPSRPQVRSLNLSNCAAIVAYEALRQWGGPGPGGAGWITP
jgi:tRNA (cytidine/uridine-2'-O-)-methyltransferase